MNLQTNRFYINQEPWSVTFNSFLIRFAIQLNKMFLTVSAVQNLSWFCVISEVLEREHNGIQNQHLNCRSELFKFTLDLQ